MKTLTHESECATQHQESEEEEHSPDRTRQDSMINDSSRLSVFSRVITGEREWRGVETRT